MKKSIQLNRSEKGFTLLEVIIIIVIAAILGSFLVTFMGTAITKSSVPVKQTRDLGTSTGDIETITAAYASYLTGTKTQAQWDAFKAACGCSGTTCTKTIPIDDAYIAKFETIQVVITTGDQKLVSYFMK